MDVLGGFQQIRLLAGDTERPYDSALQGPGQVGADGIFGVVNLRASHNVAIYLEHTNGTEAGPRLFNGEEALFGFEQRGAMWMPELVLDSSGEEEEPPEYSPPPAYEDPCPTPVYVHYVEEEEDPLRISDVDDDTEPEISVINFSDSEEEVDEEPLELRAVTNHGLLTSALSRIRSQYSSESDVEPEDWTSSSSSGSYLTAVEQVSEPEE